MPRFNIVLAMPLALALGLAACGEKAKPLTTAETPLSAAASQGAANDPDAIARAALAEMNLPDPEGLTVKALAASLRALPPWAPYYPGASLGVDSSTEGPGQVQISFTTPDSADKVAAFYLERFRQRGAPTDLNEAGVRTIEVASADGVQITSAILSPEDGGGVSVFLKHEGGGY